MEREKLAEVVFKIFKSPADKRNWRGLSERGRESWIIKAQLLEQELAKLGEGIR